MLPLKRILCPTDYSEDARSALRVANEMALYFAADLTLVHVLPPAKDPAWPVDGYHVVPVDVGHTPQDHLRNAQQSLSQEANNYISRDVSLNLEVLRGDPADEILELASRICTEMIVLATHGHSRLRTAILGSTADRIVRLAPCPVITLHAGQETSPGPVKQEAAEAES